MAKYRPARKTKLSGLQLAALKALRVLSADGSVPQARDVARRTGQSSDGAAYTLRSLVNRDLADLGHHDGDRYGYLLTDEGKAELDRNNQPS
jgi:DNA-binding MarR family transcriptional regulator